MFYYNKNYTKIKGKRDFFKKMSQLSSISKTSANNFKCWIFRNCSIEINFFKKKRKPLMVVTENILHEMFIFRIEKITFFELYKLMEVLYFFINCRNSSPPSSYSITTTNQSVTLATFWQNSSIQNDR